MKVEHLLTNDDWNLCEGLLNIYLKGAECHQISFNNDSQNNSSKGRTKSDKGGKRQLKDSKLST